MRNKIVSKILASCMILSLVACTKTNDQLDADGDVLVAYFAVAQNSIVDAASSASATIVDGEALGLTQYLGNIIAKKTSADLFSIQTSIDYPAGFNELIPYVEVEQENDERPELTTHIENFDNYDIIFIGYPIWWYDLPQIMYSFFDEYDFSGKTIIPFCVHNGSRFTGTIDTIKGLEPNATVIEDGFTVSQFDAPSCESDVLSWLEDLGY